MECIILRLILPQSDYRRIWKQDTLRVFSFRYETSSLVWNARSSIGHPYCAGTHYLSHGHMERTGIQPLRSFPRIQFIHCSLSQFVDPDSSVHKRNGSRSAIGGGWEWKSSFYLAPYKLERQRHEQHITPRSLRSMDTILESANWYPFHLKAFTQMPAVSNKDIRLCNPSFSNHVFRHARSFRRALLRLRRVIATTRSESSPSTSNRYSEKTYAEYAQQFL